MRLPSTKDAKRFVLAATGALLLLSSPAYAQHTLVASAARTESGTASVTAIPNVGMLEHAIFYLDVTAAATETGDTLDVYVQHSIDGSNWDDFISFTQVLGDGGAKQFYAVWGHRLAPESSFEVHAPSDAAQTAGTVFQGPVGTTWRIKWVVTDSGTDNASFTFSIIAETHGG